MLLFRLPGPGGLLDQLLPGDRSLLLDPGDLLLPGDLWLLFHLPGPGGLPGRLLPGDRSLLLDPGDLWLMSRLPGPEGLPGRLLPGDPEDRLLRFHPVVRDILESPAGRGVLAVP